MNRAGVDLDHLEAVARNADLLLDGASPQEVLRWTADTFGDRFCVTSSMTDGVLAHLAARVAPGVDVVFVDTGYHFAETIRTRDTVDEAYDVNVVTVTPEQTVRQQDLVHGPRLHDRNPDLCCALRKVQPLDRALARYDAWAVGVRREESPTRAHTSVVEFDARRGKVKVAPLARWTRDDVDAYVAANDVVVNPLVHDGYASIGCGPCTRRVRPGADPRSGRWAGLAKSECGINA